MRLGLAGLFLPLVRRERVKGSCDSTMKLGAFEIYPVADGRFRLDGGAMFAR